MYVHVMHITTPEEAKREISRASTPDSVAGEEAGWRMQPEMLTRAAMTMIAAALFISLFRVVRGPTLVDRVVGVDLIGVSAVCMMVLAAKASAEAAFLDTAVVIALLGFLATVAYARYAERTGGE